MSATTKYPSELDLSGRRALVTGGSRGIGLAIATRLAAAGAAVGLSSRSEDGLKEAAATIAAETGVQCPILPANVSRSEDAADLGKKALDTLGGVDILVNNAGSNPAFAPLTELDEAAWDKTMGTNLKGPFLLTRTIGAAMAAQGSGSVINISSIGGLEPSPNLGAYSVSKAGLIMLTKAFARELGPKGVRVNCIAPGLVETKFAALLVETPEIRDPAIAAAALKRYGQPDEIAGAAHFLASDASSYMTGQVMVLDGGTRL